MEPYIRDLVRQRANYRCEYCHARQENSFYAFHIEHITARQHGGADDPDNLCLACPDCNYSKGPNLSGIDPDTGAITGLFHPRRDPWEKHFQKVEGQILGLSDIGRTTAWVLAINDPDRVRQRRSERP